ncbi:MAG: hypothetical protein H0X33_11635 [Taibaiella sp.]|nr:hypothetical protein [Taibaiella sp.]
MFLFISRYPGGYTYAQKGNNNSSRDSTTKARQHVVDSTKQARQQYIDSSSQARKHQIDSAHTAQQNYIKETRETRQHAMDSIKAIRAHNLDSTKAIRKQFTDSVSTIRKYKESKHYRDSVTKARTVKANAIKQTRQVYFDSVKKLRKHVLDSAMAIRKATIAASKAVQKHRADSLGAIRKYKESKHFRDSVLVFKKARLDSMRIGRKKFSDSVTKARKVFTENLSKQRKHITDSVTKIRSHYLDSMKIVRKKRTDSLTAVKTKREKDLKSLEKKKEQKMQLALDLKIKQKHEAWSNDKMLKKKWSFTRKVIQNTFTRYNYYFNANRKMDEALANMQRVRKDNYDSLIGLYPFDPNRDSTLLAPDMDSIIHKASIGIQIHDPRSDWGNDLYLLMGEAYYYKGRYNEATTAFHYIISIDERNKKLKKGKAATASERTSIVETRKKSALDFLKHKPVHNEAVLWLSRTYTEADQPERAESVLALLEADSNLPGNLKGRLALEKAFLNLHDNDFKDASQQLNIAAADNHLPDWIRERSLFLSGQLQQKEGNYDASYASFKKVLNMNPKIDMDFYARKYMAYNVIYGGGNEADAESALKRVLDDNKYSTYYEQVYFVLGRLAANSNDNVAAIDYLQKGIHSQKTTRRQKAMSFAMMGNVYYTTGNYQAAKRSYDSAAHMSSAAAHDSMVMMAVTRSKSLDEVVSAANTIHEQDSMLALASLSTKEQRTIVRKYIRQLEQMRNDSAFRAENAGVTSIAAAEPGDETSAGVWYFSNSTMMQQGLNEFKRKWGNRQLVDNWRRNAANVFSNSNNNNNGSINNSGVNLEANNSDNGLPGEEGLLAAIPNTPAQQADANKVIERAYIDLSNAYIRQLADYSAATHSLDTLDKRYPANDKKAQALYFRYIIALRQNDVDKAKIYSTQILQDYGTTEYAALVRPSEDGAGMKNPTSGVAVGPYYDATYTLLMQHQYTDVLMRVQEAKKTYKEPKYNNRFRIMEAMALAGTSRYGEADSLITDFLRTNPTDSLRIWADAVRTYISKNKPINTTPATTAGAGGNMGSIGNSLNGGNGATAPNSPPALPGNGSSTPGNNSTPSSTTDNSLPANSTSTGKAYQYAPGDVHYCVIVLPGLESRAMGVKAAITDFNTFNFSAQKLNLNMDALSGTQALVVAKSFTNAAQAKSYMNSLKGTAPIFRDYKSGEYQVFIISANNYIRLFNDRSVQNYLLFYKSFYK